MLGDYVPLPTLAVSDLQRARDFYEGVLGFVPRDVPGEVPEEAGVLYGAGTGTVLVYPSAFAGTNKATAVAFPVPEEAFDAEVAQLREKGITFQTFEMEGITWDDGVATWAGSRAVWFEDPDGNILNVETMPVA
jgi:catechol 2,3-dioxygenase-like lactoylglutathione lyase family enzyme